MYGSSGAARQLLVDLYLSVKGFPFSSLSRRSWCKSTLLVDLLSLLSSPASLGKLDQLRPCGRSSSGYSLVGSLAQVIDIDERVGDRCASVLLCMFDLDRLVRVRASPDWSVCLTLLGLQGC